MRFLSFHSNVNLLKGREQPKILKISGGNKITDIGYHGIRQVIKIKTNYFFDLFQPVKHWDMV